MPYTLGAVKPHVKAAAESIGPKFGIRTIYGWAPGQWDHPKGLALDFMTSHKPTGDALANYVVANASALGVTYVIWYRRVWNPRQGWHKYTSTPNPHIDHVHVSFAPQPGSGAVSDVDTQQVGNPLVPDQLERLDDALQWIVNPGNWVRIGSVALGVIFVLIGLLGVSRVLGMVKKVIP